MTDIKKKNKSKKNKIILDKNTKKDTNTKNNKKDLDIETKDSDIEEEDLNIEEEEYLDSGEFIDSDNEHNEIINDIINDSENESNSDSDSDNDIDIEYIDNEDIKIVKKLQKIAKDLDLTFTEENSIKLEKNKLNSYRKCYFLINTNLVLMDNSNEKQNKTNNIINNNLDLIKKELNIKKIPKIRDSPIFEFVYGKDFINDRTKVYLGHFPEKLEVGESFEFEKNKITKRTYYQKEINNENIFQKYELLHPYKNFFNYKNFEMYYIRKNSNKIDQVGLIYMNNIEVIHFIPLFKNICKKLKWNEKNLLKILYINKDKILNIISFGNDYINIYYLENNNIRELTEEELFEMHNK
tara:strand:- start:138 stop:1196 length:1059 start_codon:yes stop_codon:yes gene_type:complete